MTIETTLTWFDPKKKLPIEYAQVLICGDSDIEDTYRIAEFKSKHIDEKTGIVREPCFWFLMGWETFLPIDKVLYWSYLPTMREDE